MRSQRRGAARLRSARVPARGRRAGEPIGDDELALRDRSSEWLQAASAHRAAADRHSTTATRRHGGRRCVRPASPCRTAGGASHSGAGHDRDRDRNGARGAGAFPLSSMGDAAEPGRERAPASNHRPLPRSGRCRFGVPAPDRDRRQRRFPGWAICRPPPGKQRRVRVDRLRCRDGDPEGSSASS